MHVRSAGAPDEPSHAGNVNETAGVSFTVPTRVVVAKFALAALLALIALFMGNRPQLVIGLLAGAALAAYGLRDVVSRERLRADADGVVAVRGYAGRRHLAWSEIERVRVDTRSRLGARSELLELDTGDKIFLFSRFDLGVDPDDAAAALEALRAR